jgi:uncharacterized protein YycO
VITLQFSTGAGPASWLVRRFTWSPYSHVDLVLPDGRLLGARGDGGVAIREPELFLTVTRFTVDAPECVIDAALEQLGKPYDWSAIAGIVTRRNWQQPDRWFCSELVAWAFESAGRPLLRAQGTHRITPRDLLLSPYLMVK